MQFRLRRVTKPIINIAPVVDVLFLLLIFFMVTTTFVEQPSIKLVLPSAKYSEAGKIEALTLIITRDGDLFLQDQPVKIEDIEKVFRDIAEKLENKTLVLKADKDVPYGKVIRIMDAAKGAGLKKIIAPTLLEDENIPSSGR